ncbi:D-alanyl-D-alanine carboxypeptidase family protein [Pseudolysinimonas sp.]|uniref:D-alanyl-D-alanine carboxypeptidase family protein n=1 Tax=Pseudolysinimonas sp. TaxID=2680009 RepID=UPI003F81367D
MARNDGDGLAQLTEIMRSTPAGAPLRSPAPRTPVDRRRRRRRRIVGLSVTGGILLLVAALVASYVGWALNAPIGAASASLAQPTVATPPAAQPVLAPEGSSAISVAGADDYLGPGASGVWQKSGDDAVPMASISKIVTALVILKAKPLSGATTPGPLITFSAADHALYDQYYVQNATIAPMPTGSSMTEHQALETMLVVSASNYAAALSTWAYGSPGAFLAATRTWLAANGLTHTAMVEPTGLDDRNRSTPADLIALGKLAMANAAVAEIVGLHSLDIPGSPVDGMSATNDMLGRNGVDGIKTGTLDTGSDLLFSATVPVPALDRPALRVFGVVLGGSSRESVDGDVETMLHNVVNGFHSTMLGREGDVVGTYTTRWGASAHMVLARDATVTTWSNAPITVTMSTGMITTGKAGQRVGAVTWTSGTTTVTVPVVLESTIRPPSDWWRITHPDKLGR